MPDWTQVSGGKWRPRAQKPGSLSSLPASEDLGDWQPAGKQMLYFCSSGLLGTKTYVSFVSLLSLHLLSTSVREVLGPIVSQRRWESAGEFGLTEAGVDCV